TDSFKVEDMLGMGMDFTFAKEGTAAADPAQYLPETDKFMLGNWQSTGVADILGDPIDMDPYALFMTFNGDHTANVMFKGEDLGTHEWSLLGDWGSFDDDDAPDISWDILDDGLEVSYVIDGEYYVFDCPKGGSIPDSAMNGGQTSGESSGDANYADFWESEWYGWWIMDNATGEYETLDGGYWDVCGGIYMDDDSDDTGFVYLWDDTGNIDDPLCVVDVSFGEGTTDAGSMVSEDGWFWTADVGHADWIVDPGASSVSGYDHMIEIYGSWEDDDGSYDYYVYLRPWGMDWEDVRADDPSNLPYYYDSWYVDAMYGVMPDEMPQDQ
nr:hypothetical protein [Clostridia bacterium]